MSQVYILNIEFTFGEKTDTIHPVILKHGEELILIDCAYPGFLEKIKAAALEQNINLDNIIKVIITHHDYDHMGSLAELKRKYPGITILSSKEQAPYIEGVKKSLRLKQAEDMYDTLPENQKPMAKYLQNLFASVENIQVDEYLPDCKQFPSDVEVIETPGHMPGHISLYLKNDKILISGDALAVQNGELGIANPQFCLDIDLAKQSVMKLLDYDIEKIICYHGGIYDKNIKASLEKIADIKR